MEADQIKAEIVAHALALGFDLARVAPAALPKRYPAAFRRWIEAGFHGDMDYLARRLREDRRAETVVPGAKSVIVLAVNYWREGEEEAPPTTAGQVSRYAVTRDYHKIVTGWLKQLSALIEARWQAPARYYVDTGPILERAYAEVAGAGYIGKHTCLITQPFGSWVFLAAIVTTLDLPPDTNDLTIRCGRCRRCLDICPTGAILEGGVVDARRCLSYLTIENRGPIPEEFRAPMGNWLFGCDLCQEVCPHNRRATPTRVEDFRQVRIGDRTLELREILALADDEAFTARFAGTPLMRAKRRGLLRNACVVAGNSGDPTLIADLEALIAREDDPMLREHATWAIVRLRQ